MESTWEPGRAVPTRHGGDAARRTPPPAVGGPGGTVSPVVADAMIPVPTAPEPVLPDYGGTWTGAVVPTLLARTAFGDADTGPGDGTGDGTGDEGPDRPAVLPAPVRDARAVVLVVIDGLGWETVARARAAPTRPAGTLGGSSAGADRRMRRLPTIAGMDGGPATTVLPSTTAAGLASIATGAPPAAHGVVGYRMRVGGRGLNVLRWQAGGGRTPEPADVQPLPPFGGRPVPVVTKAEFKSTGFTAAHLRGTDFTGYKTVSALVEHVRRLVEEGAPLVYAYYDGVDKVAHEHGLHSRTYATELEHADRLVGDLLDRLPGDAALVVTADHGQVEVGPEGAVALDDVHRLVAAYSGEGRFRGLHARAGASAELLAACEERYGDRAWVLPRDRLFDEGWLGPADGPSAGAIVRSRVGDVVLAAHAPVMFADPGQSKETRMRAQHGSATAAEVLVPLLAARGRRPALRR